MLEHRRTCNKILRDRKASSSDKATARLILNSMQDKDDGDIHCVWYVGETVRTLEDRMDEDYPLILRQFDTTHQFQIAQIPDATEYCSSKFMCLFLESTVAGSLDAATNRTRRLIAEAEGEVASLPFWELSCVNSNVAGRTRYKSMDGILLNAFMRCKTKGNENKKVREVTSNPSVHSVLRRKRFAIAFANNVDADESFEPTMMQFCRWWGKRAVELGITARATEIRVQNVKNLKRAMDNLVSVSTISPFNSTAVSRAFDNAVETLKNSSSGIRRWKRTMAFVLGQQINYMVNEHNLDREGEVVSRLVEEIGVAPSLGASTYDNGRKQHPTNETGRKQHKTLTDGRLPGSGRNVNTDKLEIAVQAKLDNPNLSVYKALTQYGRFKFDTKETDLRQKKWSEVKEVSGSKKTYKTLTSSFGSMKKRKLKEMENTK